MNEFRPHGAIPGKSRPGLKDLSGAGIPNPPEVADLIGGFWRNAPHFYALCGEDTRVGGFIHAQGVPRAGVNDKRFM
jgi:hypothetical protein